MTTKERVLAAMRGEAVDFVPFMPYFWGNTTPHVTWASDAERLAYFARREWDTYLFSPAGVSPLPEVTCDFHYETIEGMTVLHQVWHTPARTITERLRVTDDWPEAQNRTTPLFFEGDFRSPRYLEVPFKEPADLDALPYLFPIEKPGDFDLARAQYPAVKALADTFGVPIFYYFVAGMDWLTYLYPPHELVLRFMDDRPMMEGIVRHINRAYGRRLDIMLELGIDAVMRRALYETTDYWNPAIFNDFAAPLLEREIAITHEGGALFILDMMSGFQPLLPRLATMDFDCLSFFDPVIGGLDPDMAALRRALPGKAFRGGLSGPMHLQFGTPAEVETAVEQAFHAYGPQGLLLCHAGAFRENWPWENLEAADQAWRRLRYLQE